MKLLVFCGYFTKGAADFHTLEHTLYFGNPVEMAEFIGAYIENQEDFALSMWISLDEDVLIHINESNADEIIRYLYERYPY